MTDPTRDLRDPSWLRRARTLALRLGPVGATAALSAFATALVVALAVPLALVLGSGIGAAATVAAASALALAPPLGWLLVRLLYKLEAARRQLVLQATRDPLTGWPNRRHFVAAAEREWSRCQRYGVDGALLLVDPDHFERLNETHGTACGDAVLREFARAVAQTLRPADLIGRFGGELLAVFLPHTDPIGALDVAERLRLQLGDLRVDWGGVAVGTTVSVGVASVNAAQTSVDALIQDADAALQVAKQAGRNCVRAAPVLPRAAAVRGSSIGDRRAAGLG